MARLNKSLLNYESIYEQNGILKNKLNITNKEELDMIERNETSYKLANLYLNPGKQTWDINHYLSIHKFLFERIYDFAGEIRSECINKRIPFCLPNLIYDNLNDVLRKAYNKSNFLDSREKLLSYIVELYSDLDIIHPFREGNGRTEREFIRQYIKFVCEKNNLDNYFLDYSNVDKEKFINAVVKADALLDYNDLYLLFDEILVINDKKISKKR